MTCSTTAGRSRRHIALAATAVAILALPAAPAHASWPGLNGRISFTQRVPGGPSNKPPANRDLFAGALDGTLAHLTTSTKNDEQSSWSPDGLRVAFKRTNEVFVLRDLATGAEMQVTNDPGSDDPFNTQPAWSPDGTRLLFRSSRQDPTQRVGDIWVVAADSTDPGFGHPTRVLARPGDERYPSYSPDGRWIAFRGDDDGIDATGDEELFVMRADGTGVEQLTDNAVFDSAPAWSPDGTKLAFESDRAGGAREIFVMDLADRSVVQLTDNVVHDEGPAWSPDGRMIAFTRAADQVAPGDIWVMNADGTGQRPLVETPIIEESPDWQPLPFAVGAPDIPRVACGDLSLLPGGAASIVTVKSTCAQALDVAGRWVAAATLGAFDEKVEGFVCSTRPHSFDQVVVECDHRGSKKGVAFVWRRAAA
jgi:TolB protein